MASEMEMRHRERELLFDLLQAEKENNFKRVIRKLMSSMEQEDVKLVKQQLSEYNNE